MRKMLTAACAAFAAALAVGGPVQAQDSGVDIDIGGPWLFKMSGGQGTIVLNFGVPSAGIFTVRGAGVSRAHRASFAVSDDTTPTLAFASTGQIRGSVPLEDLTQTTTVGALDITGGWLNATNDRALLKGRLNVNGTPKNVVLRGLRRVEPTTDLAGGSFDGTVRGRSMSSRKLDLTLVKRDLTGPLGLKPEEKGFPFFTLSASGPVHVDRGEVPFFGFGGFVVLDADYGVAGRVTTTQFGDANVSGTMTIDETVGRPTLSILVTPDSGRAFRVRCLLQQFAAEETN